MIGILTAAQERGITEALRAWRSAESDRAARRVDERRETCADVISSPHLPAMVEALVEATPRVKWAHAPTVDDDASVRMIPSPLAHLPYKPNRAERREAARKTRR